MKVLSPRVTLYIKLDVNDYVVSNTHYFVGDQIRQTIERIKQPMPEDMPTGPSRGLPMVGTESWNRKIAQKNYGSLEGNLEKLFRRGGELYLSAKW